MIRAASVHGVLHRGTVLMTGIEPHELQPVVVWRIQDQDHHDLGEYAGDYADAERMLLDATGWADQLGNQKDTEE